jgi:hypothetical protein
MRMEIAYEAGRAGAKTILGKSPEDIEARRVRREAAVAAGALKVEGSVDGPRCGYARRSLSGTTGWRRSSPEPAIPPGTASYASEVAFALLSPLPRDVLFESGIA